MGQRGNGGLLHQIPDGQLDGGGGAHTGDDLPGQQGMTAEIKEAVINADSRRG